MKSDYVFLSVDGKLTMSSASHLRNLAAVKANEILSQLENLSFVNEYIGLIDSKEFNQTHFGTNYAALCNIPDQIEKVALYHSFEAWINEAIEAKQRLFSEIKSLSLEEWAASQGIELPNKPIPEAAMNEDDYLETLTVKERNRFLTLQSKVSAIGNLIHKGNAYDTALKNLQNSITNPIKETLNGRDTILKKYEPSVSIDSVNDIYFKLQNTHREYQAQLNGMKEARDQAIKRDAIEKTSKYREEWSRYTDVMAKYEADLTAYKQSKNAELEKLKIVIPEHLMSVYNELTVLGK